MYQAVISDTCQRMGTGMAEFLEKKVTSVREWDKVGVALRGPPGVPSQ